MERTLARRRFRVQFLHPADEGGRIRSAYAFLSLVVVYFIPFAPRATRAVWFYNRRILGYGRLHSAVKLYAHYYALGQTIIDRVAIGSGMERKYKFEFENYDAFLRVIDGGRGAVIIGAHVGCGHGGRFFGDYARKMHLVMYDAEYRQIKSVMEKHWRAQGDRGERGRHRMRIKEVLDREERLLQGDRFVEGSPTVTLPFMRHEAPFPAGPFAVTRKSPRPVVFYYAMRERGRRFPSSSTSRTRTGAARRRPYSAATYARSRPW